MFDFKFDRPFYKEKEFLKIVPVPRSTFFHWQNEWISKGNDPLEMGKMEMRDSSAVYWNGPKFLKWLIENKIKQNPKYDYQEEQKKTALVVINKLNKRKTINEK